jgi:DnaJ-class molecular chaperone
MDYFGILQLPRNASPEQIKKQFRKLSLETHPDRPNGNAERFQEINEAYEKLTQPQEVQLPPWMNGGRGMPNPEDILMEMFGMGGMPNIVFEAMPMRQEPPLVIRLPITLDQAYTGARLPIEIQRSVGRSVEVERCYIQVPQGADHNEFIPLPGKGHVGPGGARGDAQVVLQLECPPHLKRHGWDIHYRHAITLKEALCGFAVEFDYLQGKKLKIANTEGTIVAPSFKKVIPSMGMVRDNHKGSLVIEFDIAFPPALTEEQRSALSGLLP